MVSKLYDLSKEKKKIVLVSLAKLIWRPKVTAIEEA